MYHSICQKYRKPGREVCSPCLGMKGSPFPSNTQLVGGRALVCTGSRNYVGNSEISRG
jgi:hypothetical protein